MCVSLPWTQTSSRSSRPPVPDTEASSTLKNKGSEPTVRCDRAEWGQAHSSRSGTPVQPCYHAAWYSFCPRAARASTWGALRRAGGI